MAYNKWNGNARPALGHHTGTCPKALGAWNMSVDYHVKPAHAPALTLGGSRGHTSHQDLDNNL